MRRQRLALLVFVTSCAGSSAPRGNAAGSPVVAIPAETDDSSEARETPEPDPWQELLAADAVFAKPWADGICGLGHRAHAVRGADSPDSALGQRALQAGCRFTSRSLSPDPSPMSPFPIVLTSAFCCPGNLEQAPSAPAGLGKSCAQAQQEYVQAYQAASDSGALPDLTASQYGAMLNRGAYFAHCGVPDSMGLRICAAVQYGRAVGVTVVAEPPDERILQCVEHAVRALQFPAHPRLDITFTQFAPAG